MKRLIVIICFFVLCMALIAVAAEKPANFSGTWIQDMKESDPAPRSIRNLGQTANVEGGGGFGGGMGGMGGMGGGMGGGFGGGFPGGGFPKSKAGQPAPEPPPLVLEQDENELRIPTVVKGIGGSPDTQAVERFKFDGKEVVEMIPVPNADKPLKRTTKVSFSKNKIQVKQTTATSQGNNEYRRTYSLSKDGKELTLNIKTQIAMGLQVMQTEQKLVYKRQ